MGVVIDLEDARLAREPHRTAGVWCRQCGATWVAVWPETVNPCYLECPKCSKQDSALLSEDMPPT